jgi:group I intron endonuclease
MINTIYALKNKINDKIYIGQTWKSLDERWNRGHGYIGSHKIHGAIKKYGKENFFYQALAFCSTQDTANITESYFIQKFDAIQNGYNINIGGTYGVMTGRKHSSESIAKMSISHQGNTAHLSKPHSDDTKARLSAAATLQFETHGHPSLGLITPDHVRLKQSIARKGIRKSQVSEFKPLISFTIATMIRADVAAGATHASTAVKYGISRPLVTMIVNNKRWIK